jgi:hypothetical protein
MARKIRWQIKFKTLKNKDGRIDIYEEGWDGGVTELEPAANPITTEEDSDDDYLKPIRSQTGYLRVVDNGDLEGLMPSDNSQHYVELHIDNELEWRGYMQADTFSEDWDVTPLVIEYPLISPIGLLDGVYLDQEKGMGVVMLAELFLECIEATGVAYDNVYYPREVWYDENEGGLKAPFEISLSRQTFFKDNGSDEKDSEDWKRYDADTCLSFLEEFCKFWGWTLHERKKDLYFIGQADECYKTTMENIRKIVYGGTYIANRQVVKEIDFSLLSLDGSDNKKEILQGVNKLKVVAKIDAVGTVVPSIDEGFMNVIYDGTITYKTNDTITGYKKVIAYESENTDVQMKVYRGRFTDDGDWVWEDSPYIFNNMMIGVGAMYVKRDIYSAGDLQNKRNYNYKNGIWIIARSEQIISRPGLEQARGMPILVMRSANAAKYSNGAFVISGQTTGYETALMLNPNNPTDGAGAIEIKFRVGDKWWNGSGWSNNEVWFEIQAGSENGYSIPGKILSTKTLDMPYNGADGYVMPINEDLSGIVELTMHAIVNTAMYKQLYIDNLKVDYYKDDRLNPVGKSNKNENVYVSLLKRRASGEKELELKIASNNNNQAAYNTLYGAGRDIGPLYFVQEGASMLAEQHLLGILKQVYGRVIEKLNITVERSDLTPMMRLVRDEKVYRILSEKIEWADESEEIMIENIPG